MVGDGSGDCICGTIKFSSSCEVVMNVDGLACGSFHTIEA